MFVLVRSSHTLPPHHHHHFSPASPNHYLIILVILVIIFQFALFHLPDLYCHSFGIHYLRKCVLITAVAVYIFEECKVDLSPKINPAPMMLRGCVKKVENLF